jgi:hypothetical protein
MLFPGLTPICVSQRRSLDPGHSFELAPERVRLDRCHHHRHSIEAGDLNQSFAFESGIGSPRIEGLGVDDGRADDQPD